MDEWWVVALKWLGANWIAVGTLAAAVATVIYSALTPSRVQKRQAKDEVEHWLRQEKHAAYASFLRVSVECTDAVDRFAKSPRRTENAVVNKRAKERQEVAQGLVSDLRDAGFACALVSESAVGTHVLAFVAATNRNLNAAIRQSDARFPRQDAHKHHAAIRKAMRRDIQRTGGERGTLNKLAAFKDEQFAFTQRTPLLETSESKEESATPSASATE